MADVNTLSLDEVPVRQRYQYFKFLIQNKVEFEHDETGNYTATVRVQNSPELEKRYNRTPKSYKKPTTASTNKARKKAKLSDKYPNLDRDLLRQNLFSTSTKVSSNRTPDKRAISPL